MSHSCSQVVPALDGCEQLEANFAGWFVFTAAASELTSWKAGPAIFWCCGSLCLFPWQFVQGGFLPWADDGRLLGLAALSRRSCAGQSHQQLCKKVLPGSVLGGRGGHKAVRVVCRRSEGTGWCLKSIFHQDILYSYSERCRRVQHTCRPARKVQQLCSFPHSILFIPLGGRGGAAALVFPPGLALCRGE